MKFIRDEHGMLFVVSAPSGGGKTSLCKEVIKRLPNFEHGISYTTRERRPTEVDGKDYYFISEEKKFRSPAMFNRRGMINNYMTLSAYGFLGVGGVYAKADVFIPEYPDGPQRDPEGCPAEFDVR